MIRCKAFGTNFAGIFLVTIFCVSRLNMTRHQFLSNHCSTDGAWSFFMHIHNMDFYFNRFSLQLFQNLLFWKWMEKTITQKWQIWHQIFSDLPNYLHRTCSDAAWHTYLPKNLTSYVNAPFVNIIDVFLSFSYLTHHRNSSFRWGKNP